MSVINNLSLKYLKKNKRKVIVIILSIILSTTLLVAVSLGASTIRGHNINYALDSVGGHHAIFKNLGYNAYKNLVNDEKITNVISLQEIEQFNSNTIVNISLEEEFILTVKSLNNTFDGYITLEKGRYPENNREIIISDNLMYTIGYDINDYINGFKIVGIYTDNKLEIEEYYYIFGGEQVFAPIVITNDKIKENLTGNYIVTFKNSLFMYKDIYAKADELGLTYTILQNGSRQYDKMEENGLLLQSLGQYDNIKWQLGSYAYLILILLVVSLFCVSTIRNSFLISLSERKKYFGTLRSIGTSKKQIFKMILFETILISVISIPIGVILGFSFTEFIINIINGIMKTFITSDYKLIVYPIYLIISFIFIIITIILSAVAPAKKASEITPIEIIRENKTYSVIKSKEHYPIVKKIFGNEGELAYKTIKRNNSKFSVTVDSLVVSIILFITLSAFTNFILANNTYESNEYYDITFGIEETTKKEEIIEKIKDFEEIDEILIKADVHPYYKLDTNILTNEANNNTNYDNAYNIIDIVGLDEDIYNRLIKKYKLKPNEKAILYNFIDMYDANTGKYDSYLWFNSNLSNIKICNYSNNNCYYSFDDIYVVNNKIFDDMNYSPTIILPMKDYNTFVDNYLKLNDEGWLIDDATTTNVGINTDKFIEIDKKFEQLFKDYANLDLESWYQNDKLSNYEEYTIVTAIRFVINSAMILIVIIILTSIVNTISTNLALRETEFSVLRSVGLSKKGLHKMLFLESLFLGVRAICLGLSISTFFVFAEMYLASVMSSSTKFEFPYGAYIISIISIFLIVFIMVLYSSHKVKDKNIIDSIRKQSI